MNAVSRPPRPRRRVRARWVGLLTTAALVASSAALTVPPAAAQPAAPVARASVGQADPAPTTLRATGPRLVAFAARANGSYLTATARGDVYAFGTKNLGSPRGGHGKLRSPVVGIATAPGSGYVVATARGDVYAFGTKNLGSPRSRHGKLRSPVAAIATAPGGGYVVATARGDVYAFGTKNLGSPRSRHGKLRSPVAAIATAPGGGYVIATARGDVYAFGTKNLGSPRGRHGKLTSRVTGIAATADGGYLTVTARGDLDTFGTKDLGSPRGLPGRRGSAVIGIAAVHGGYLTATARGEVHSFGQGSAGPGDLLACAKPAAATTPLPGAPSTLPGAAPGASLGGRLLTLLFDGAVTYAEDDGLGWLMKLAGGLLGKEDGPTIDPAHLDQQFADVDTKVTALQNQTYSDCLAVQSAIAALKDDVDKGNYTTRAGQASQFVTAIQSHARNYATVLGHLTQNGGSLAALSDTDKKYLVSMRTGGSGDKSLPDLIDQVSSYESDGGGGSDTLISLYTIVLRDQYGYNPYSSHIFPAAFVNAAAAQQSYYANVLTEAAYLYANVAHLSFDYGGSHYGTDGASVVDLVTRVQDDIQGWDAEFSDGDGTPGWVSQGPDHQFGIGAMAPDTVLDYRIRNAPRLWTDVPAALTGDPATPAPYYCGTTAPFCYANRFDAGGHVASTALVRPSAVPLHESVEQQGHDGTGGWRIPTTADWAGLQQGSTGSLSAWGTAHQLRVFDPETITSGWAGGSASLSTIPPVLVNTGTVQDPAYGVLSAADALAGGGLPPTALTAQHAPFESQENPDAQSASAGRLFLVQNFRPTAPTPHSPGHDQAPPSARPTSSSPPAASTVPRPATGRAKAVPGPTTFDQPTACQDATTYVVPEGAASVQVTATGAAGTDSHNSTGVDGRGGRGGTVTTTIPAPAGTTLWISVGGNSRSASGDGLRAAGQGGGTGGATHSQSGGFYAGGGGGSSAVSSAAGCSAPLVVAGGGGGGGGGSGLVGGGRGGDACSASDPTCQQAGNGESSASQTQYAGKRGGNVPGNWGGDAGHALSDVPADARGATGTVLQGGGGGSADQQGGGGGGGGGGYPGGGGGGGSGIGYDNGAGGGGGGGGTFGIPSYAGAPVLGLGARELPGSVTITPVTKAPAALTIAASPASPAYGDPWQLIATLPQAAFGAVGFYDDVDNGCERGDRTHCVGLGTATNRNGTAVLPDVSLAVGTHRIHASYLGDDDTFTGDAYYATSDATPITVTVRQAVPALVLTVQGTVLYTSTGPKAPTSLVVRLPADATGYVGFYDLSTTGGPDTVIGSAAVVDGYATLTTLRAPLGLGKHTIRASSSGDGNYTSGNSNRVVVTVAVAPPG